MGIKLFLIRHGQTLWNREGRYQGEMDIGLTRVGFKQARLAAKYLSKVDFSNIYSSPLRRAIDTANIINKTKNLKIIARENLKEINFGKWEGMKFDEINRMFHDDYQNWIGDPYNNSPTGGESFKKLEGRTTVEIDKIVNENGDGSSVAVITHGGVILSLLVHWLQIPLSRWKSIIQRQGAINIAVIDRGFPYISAINYTGHLKPVYDDSEDKVIEIYSGLRNRN
ncbi:MAG: alpha-ribazole phosphatase [Actinobacteria bacterium]|nr:alpha-ribazole phosphatase [Actinomycetota bacterium]MBL7123965.1 alpha-ribazole phosphatase [Actinomycetota bacterium]